MGTLNKQFNFVEDTDIEPSEVNTNFNDIIAFINSELMHRDGSKDFTAVPTGPNADPTSANHLTRKAYVDAKVAPVAALVAQKMNEDSRRHGRTDGMTNAAGDFVITHNLGRIATSIQLTPLGVGVTSHVWTPIVENHDQSTINVRIFDSTTGLPIANQGPFPTFWHVSG